MPKRPLPAGLRPDRPVDIANRLNSAAIHLLRRISRDDGADGVTGARLSALSVLVYGGPQTVSTLARREGVATPTMTRIVDALVRDGIVTRTPVAARSPPGAASRPPRTGGASWSAAAPGGSSAWPARSRALRPKQHKALERALEILESLEPQEPAR